MAKVAVLLAADFEDSEFRKPVDALRAAGHEVVVLGEKAGASVDGKKGKEHVVLDAAVESKTADDFDALVIPGGYSPDHLRLQDGAVAFTKAFAKAGKPIAAVCHGPQLLISAGIVADRTVTSWPSIRVDLENANANWVDRSVVVDDFLITSRKPDDLDDFNAALLDSLRAGKARKRAAQ